MENSNNDKDLVPQVDHKPIPLWIKVMWILGVAWIILYIFQGLKHTPSTW